MLAEVLCSCGHSYLSIAGIAVAMDGDPCRDGDVPGLRETIWSRGGLLLVAERINRAAEAAAKEKT